VRALRAEGVDAFGLSGEDGGVIIGRLVEQGKLGRVGEVVTIRTELIRALLSAGLLPVLSPVSVGEDGQALNINADEVATSIAAELGAEELLFLTDVEGVLVNGVRAQILKTSEAKQLVSSGVATGGMAVKLRAGVAALQAGVARVRVGPLEMLSDPNAGTALTEEALAWR
jgi:acetylglutamate kinase